MLMMNPEPIVRDNIEIGRFTYFPEDFEFKTWIPGEKVIIGSFCSIGNHVFICTGGNHRSDIASTYPFDFFFLGRPKPNRCYQGTHTTTIGNDVWLGRRSTVMGGAKIGHGAVVAANSVVFSDIPPYGIAAGNPAQVIRYRFSRPIIDRMLSIAWWDWPETKLRANVEWFYRPISEFVEYFSSQRDASDVHSPHARGPHRSLAAPIENPVLDPTRHAAS
jgi:virginiamycin A acetyltransferase